MSYVGKIERTAEGYLATFPDAAGLRADGKTIGIAERRARFVLREYLVKLHKDGHSFPDAKYKTDNRLKKFRPFTVRFDLEDLVS